MSEARKLLDAATPLPWQVDGRAMVHRWFAKNDDGQYVYTDEPQNAALIVHTVNRLPDYEAAVDALERLLDQVEDTDSCPICMETMNDPLPPDAHHTEECGATDARAVLRRLRGEA